WGRRSSRMAISGCFAINCCTIETVRSVDPSSTTMISSGGDVCAQTERRVDSTSDSRLNTGTTTEIVLSSTGAALTAISDRCRGYTGRLIPAAVDVDTRKELQHEQDERAMDGHATGRRTGDGAPVDRLVPPGPCRRAVARQHRVNQLADGSAKPVEDGRI